MNNNNEYIVAFHPCYRSEIDLGLRVYKCDDQYLQDHPSMYSVEGYFPTAEDAVAYVGKQVIGIDRRKV